MKSFKIIALVGWMSIIFVMSNMPVETSWKLSGAVTSEVIESVDNNPTDIDQNNNKIMGFTKDEINMFVRKIAHMGEFFILFLLWYVVLIKEKNKNILLYSAIIAIFYAMTDEFHQLFVQGRTANIVDVGVDSIGVICGVFTIIIIKKITEVIQKKIEI